MNLRIWLLSIVLGTAGLACSASSGMWPRPDVCRPPDGLAGQAAAVECAEAFVARNGYTLAPPVDSAELVLEFLECGGSVEELLACRRGTLESWAAVVCDGSAGRQGNTVAFQYADQTVSRNGRAVTMSRGFTRLEIGHQDFLLADAMQGAFGCRPLP